MNINIFKNFTSQNKSDVVPKDKQRIDVSHDWKLILMVTAIVLIGLISWSLYLHTQITNDQYNSSGIQTPVARSKEKKKRNEAVSNIFLEKAKKHEELKNTPLPVSDPSR